MSGYCDYCGMGYIDVECEICGALFDTCGCNVAQTICDECDARMEDPVHRSEQRQVASEEYEITIQDIWGG